MVSLFALNRVFSPLPLILKIPRDRQCVAISGRSDIVKGSLARMFLGFCPDAFKFPVLYTTRLTQPGGGEIEPGVSAKSAVTSTLLYQTNCSIRFYQRPSLTQKQVQQELGGLIDYRNKFVKQTSPSPSQHALRCARSPTLQTSRQDPEIAVRRRKMTKLDWQEKVEVENPGRIVCTTRLSPMVA